MYHSDETLIATALPEPPDGSKVVVDMGDEWRVIWRDDAEAESLGAVDGERWFDSHDSDPMGWYVHLKYAQSVYLLSEPLVRFAGPNEVAR